MNEKYYVFVKDNIVKNIAVFSNQNEELADRIAHENGYDDAIWVGENPPAIYSEYKNGEFFDPDLDYLYEIKISPFNKLMLEELNV